MKSFGWSLIQITLILLKAFHVIDWSWTWVLFPMWIGFAIFFVAFCFAFVVAFINEVIKSKRRW